METEIGYFLFNGVPGTLPAATKTFPKNLWKYSNVIGMGLWSQRNETSDDYILDVKYHGSSLFIFL